jgi:putative ABC transport system ATP-binding protein
LGLAEILPYVATELDTIAKGWACAAALYYLSRAVPAVGVAASVATRGEVALARASAAYAQQVLLWEVAAGARLHAAAGA